MFAREAKRGRGWALSRRLHTWVRSQPPLLLPRVQSTSRVLHLTRSQRVCKCLPLRVKLTRAKATCVGVGGSVQTGSRSNLICRRVWFEEDRFSAVWMTKRYMKCNFSQAGSSLVWSVSTFLRFLLIIREREILQCVTRKSSRALSCHFLSTIKKINIPQPIRFQYK